MPSSDPPPTAAPVETAGLLLAARPIAVVHGLPWPSAEEIVAATSGSREQAYEIADALVAALPALEQSLGQGCSEPAVAHNLRLDALTREALRFAMRHPGCALRSSRYLARYRRFVIELRTRYADVPASEFAEAIALPLGTLEGWLRRQRRAVAAGAAQNPDEPPAAAPSAAQA